MFNVEPIKQIRCFVEISFLKQSHFTAGDYTITHMCMIFFLDLLVSVFFFFNVLVKIVSMGICIHECYYVYECMVCIQVQCTRSKTMKYQKNQNQIQINSIRKV